MSDPWLGLMRYAVVAACALVISAFSIASGQQAGGDRELVLEPVAGVPGSEQSIYVAFVPPSDGAPYSFWFEGSAGFAADWTLPEGAELGDTIFPALVEIEPGLPPQFGFEPGGRIVQEIKLPTEFSGEAQIGLTLGYGVCENDCVINSATAATSFSGVDLDTVTEERSKALRESGIPFQRSGLMLRAGEGQLSFGVNMNRVERGTVSRGWLLPFDSATFASGEALEMSSYATGFFTTFNIGAGVGETLERMRGIVVTYRTDVRGIDAFWVREPNDFLEATTLVNAPAEEGMTFLTAALWALLGGIILNIMPCVFPVLAMKVFGLVRAGTESRAALRKDGIAYSVGVVSSFMVVAGVLMAVRSVDDGAMWGFQLQSAPFVLSMTILLFLIGLNFLGIFEISSRFTGIGQKLTEKEGPAGSFFTGVLAAVVATPCTAPFMAAAVAFALTQPTGVGLAVFFALGLGLALPYLVVTFIPGAHKIFPKPGTWMVTFREFLAFPIFATVVWLMWILNIQSGSTGLLFALSAMVFLGFVLWAWKKIEASRMLLRGLLAAIFLTAVILPVNRVSLLSPAMGNTMAANHGSLKIVPYSEAQLAAYRADGKPVFLHFWAAWCIICLMHENMVFSTAEYQDYLSDRDIIFMRIDNTVRDPKVRGLMESFGRMGQPLDIIYPGDPMREPVVLPELFTTAKVTASMDEVLGE